MFLKLQCSEHLAMLSIRDTANDNEQLNILQHGTSRVTDHNHPSSHSPTLISSV